MSVYLVQREKSEVSNSEFANINCDHKPAVYNYWDELGLYAYWRILWIIPVIPVLAGLVPSITERIQNGWIKAVVVAAGVSFIVFGGTFLYNGTGGAFVEAANAAKLPENVVRIADRLLELNDHPRVIAQDPVGVYIRQYTADITTLYGRDIGNNYISTPSYEAKTVHRALSSGEDIEAVSQLMLNDGFDYLVYNGDAGKGFQLVDRVGGYVIYRAVGQPSVRKERNELGQVVKRTTVDDGGNPVSIPEGYAKVEYEYDENGFICTEKYSDKKDYPVITSSGYAEVYRTLDAKGRVIREEYFDTAGAPVKQPAGHVGIEQEYDSEGRLISRTYLNAEGQPINRVDGYSKAVWNCEGGTTAVEFYDIAGNKLDTTGFNLVMDIKTFPDGWSEWYTPEQNTANYGITIGTAILDEKVIGDIYTCQIEVEFKGVIALEGKSFLFATQGRGDGSWQNGNIWNSKLIWKGTPLDNGVYSFSSTMEIDESLVNIGTFELGFRCDNWDSGSFRVRGVKVEKGETATNWSPGI